MDTAFADLGDGHTRAQRVDVFKPRDDEQRPGRITRNLATKGAALVVCSKDFPTATQDAVKHWNDRLEPDVLAFESRQEACSKLEKTPDGGWAPKDGVVAVFVSVGASSPSGYDGRVVDDECDSESIACVRQDGVSSTLRTRYGRLEAIFNPKRYCRDAGAQPTAVCTIDTQPVGRQKDDDLRYVIAHELGHALSLGDYFCNHRDPDNTNNDTNRHPDFIDVPTLMNSYSFSALALRRICNSPDGSPTARDISDYRTIYRPAAVTGLSAETNGMTLTLQWNQAQVFVESEFEIEEWNDEEERWVLVATATANSTSQTFPVEALATAPQRPLALRYRIIARTLALKEEVAGHGHAHGTPSDELLVTVLPPLAAPTIDEVTGTERSLTLVWAGVTGAGGYLARRTTAMSCDDPAPGRLDAAMNADTLTATFTVDPRTTYLLCVRATPSSNSKSESDWVSIVATPPQPLTVTASIEGSANCRAGGSISVRWKATGGLAPYTVSADREAIDKSASATKSTLVPCGSSAGERTVALTVTDNHTPMRSGTASVSFTVTGPPPQPPNPPQPCAGKERPDDFATPPVSGTTVDTRWGPPTFVSPSFCVEYEEQRTTTVTAYASVTYSCDGTCWVAGVKVITSEHVGNWVRTGNIRQCNFGPSSAGQSATLSAGDYELQWGGRRVAFTVPAGASVTLEWREQQGGGYAAVLSTKDGAEMIVRPPTSSGAAQGQAQASEASVPNDPTLVSVADSMRNPATAQTSTVTTTAECAVAEQSAGGTTSVDLDADSCVIVRLGGTVTVKADGQSRSFALSAEQEWLIIDATETSGGGTAAVTLLHIASGAYITLALSDGTELSRHVPDGESEVASLFNALASATSASGGD